MVYDNLAMLFHRERCYNFANIKPWAAQLAQGRCKWHHLRLETRRHPVSRRRAPATPAKNSAPKGYRHPGYPQRSFRWNQWGLVLQRYEGVMKWRPANNELCSSFSIMVPHFSINIWNRCFYPMSPQKTPPRPLLLDLRTSTNDEKVTVGTRHFNSDLFAKDFPKSLPWFDDCWYLLIVDATASLRGDLLYARGWWTSVYHFFQCSLGYQGCDPYPYGGFLK